MKTTKYVLMRNKKEVGVFKSYEQARSQARKLIRTMFKTVEARDKYAAKVHGMWDHVSRNPTNITAVGFRIVRT